MSVFISMPLSIEQLSPIDLKAGDSGPARSVRLTDASKRYLSFDGTETITYRLLPVAGGEILTGNGSWISPELGAVQFDFPEGVPPAGKYYEEWLITQGSETHTFPGRGYILVTIYDRLA